MTSLIPAVILSCSHHDEISEIRKMVDTIRIVDTHEHFNPEVSRVKINADFFTLVIGYLQADMISSGMSDKELSLMLDQKLSFDERWQVFDRYWNNACLTGYGKCLTASARILFGADSINKATALAIDSVMRTSCSREGWYRHVLKEKSGVDVSIVDPLGKDAEDVSLYSAEFFVTVRRFDNYVRFNRKFISSLEELNGTSIRSLDDFLKALDNDFEKAIKKDHIVAIKSGLAYGRILYYEDVPREKAEPVFAKLLESGKPGDPAEQKMLEDFMMHQVVARAEKYNLPIQIHTGILSRNFNNSNPVENLNAIHLSNLFLKYRNAKFVIFHGSYPYMAELAYLAKHYPNVYIDMCWMYIISPLASRNYLEEWLLTVPSNKITGFGGDDSIEWTAGHAEMAREVISEVLEKMVKEGSLSEKGAGDLAEKLLRKNAISLYNLEKVNGSWRRRIQAPSLSEL